MNKEQFNREKNYGVVMAVARSMLSKGIINEDDYLKIDAIFREKYRPLIGSQMARFA